jgi:AmmeMemoRadiSam system protein A
MSSIETVELSREQRDTLLAIAKQSIDYGLSHGRPLPVDPDDYPAPLQTLRATFVTLHESGQLRGCIGTLEAHRPLVEDVADNAFSAAFRDPRFAPVSAAERDRLALDISVLSPATPMQFASEQDLLRQLRPGIDGLVLEDGPYRGTFLPSVWEQLPEPVDFLRQLKRKAGLSVDHWSPSLKVSRYVTESFS